jgi:hypothetical protein
MWCETHSSGWGGCSSLVEGALVSERAKFEGRRWRCEDHYAVLGIEKNADETDIHEVDCGVSACCCSLSKLFLLWS